MDFWPYSWSTCSASCCLNLDWLPILKTKACFLEISRRKKNIPWGWSAAGRCLGDLITTTSAVLLPLCSFLILLLTLQLFMKYHRLHNICPNSPAMPTTLYIKVSDLSELTFVFPDGSVVKNPPVKAGDIEDTGSIPESGRYTGGGNGSPLQYSCWSVPWTEKPGGLRPWRSQRGTHVLATRQQLSVPPSPSATGKKKKRGAVTTWKKHTFF